MSSHPLTVKARALLSQTAVLDIELLETLTLIVKGNVHRAEACDDPRTYCVKRLGMSDDSAYRRLYSADLLDRYPQLVRPLIASREIHLTGLAYLHRVITDENAAELLGEARGKTKAEIEEIVCRIKPRQPVTASVKRVAAKQISKSPPLPLSPTATMQSDTEKEDATPRSAAAGEPVCDVRPVVREAPVADPFTHRFVCMMTEATKAQLDAARDLLPKAGLNELFAEAVALLVERTMMKKRRSLKQTRGEKSRKSKGAENVVTDTRVEAEAAANVEALLSADLPDDNRTGADDARPSSGELGAEGTGSRAGPGESSGSGSGTRYDPMLAVGPAGYKRYASAALARAVFVRDNNECQFRDEDGNQCCSRRYLQLHHCVAWARGGATTAANLKVYCRSHNLYQAELDFGPREAA